MNSSAVLRIFCVTCLAIAFAFTTTASDAASVRGVALNSSDPLLVKGEDGCIYECEWYGGSQNFWKGDTVLLTETFGFAHLVGLSGTSKGECAKVHVDEL